MSVLDIRDLCFTYDGAWTPVFDHTSLRLDTDWRLGFTGRNGRGKTTFLRILMGELPYRGQILGGKRFRYFPKPLENPDWPALEALSAVNPELPLWALERELDRLGLDESLRRQPFSTLSGGQQTRAMMALLFGEEDDFPLIDEPTNHLDMAGRSRLAEYLKTKPGFILVSHDRAFLDACVDHILSINRTQIEIQAGNFSSWYENKSRQDAFETAKNAQLKKEIHRLEAAAREKAQWSDTAEGRKIGFDPTKVEKNTGRRAYEGAKAKKAAASGKAVEQRVQSAIAEKSALLKDVEEMEALKLHPLAYHSRRLLSLEHVSLAYGEKTVCCDLSFSLERGERIALTGGNGSGKSTVLRLLCEKNPDIRVEGSLQRGSGLIISYVPQDVSGLCGSLSEYEGKWQLNRPLFRAILRKLDFSRNQLEQPMEAYSAGQKKKVALARSLCQQAHLYVWDEPLNYIDVFSRMQIETLLTEYAPTLLFVEHDRAFVEHLASRIISL